MMLQRKHYKVTWLTSTVCGNLKLFYLEFKFKILDNDCMHGFQKMKSSFESCMQEFSYYTFISFLYMPTVPNVQRVNARSYHTDEVIQR